MNSKFHFGLLESFLAVVIVLSVVPAIVILSNSMRVDEGEIYEDGQDSVTIEEIDYDHESGVVSATTSTGKTVESESTYTAVYEEGEGSVGVDSWDVNHTDDYVEVTLTNGEVIQDASVYDQVYQEGYDDGYAEGQGDANPEQMDLTVQEAEPSNPEENQVWVKSDDLTVEGVRIAEQDDNVQADELWLRHVQRKSNALGTTLDVSYGGETWEVDLARAGSIYDGTDWVTPEIYIWIDGEWESFYYGEAFIYMTTDDGTVYKLNNFNEEEWSYSLDAFDLGSIKVDPDGYVYVAGGNNSSIVKLSPSGTEEWTYENPDTGDVDDVSVDLNGNVYITTGNNDILIKIDSDGNQVWEYDEATAQVSSVSVGPDGYIYAGDWNNNVHKIDSDGNQVWTYTAGDEIQAIEVYDEDSIYISTRGDGIHKINGSGNEQWIYKTETYPDEVIWDIAVDHNENVYGAFYNSEDIRKIDSQGNLEWTYGDHSARVYGLDVDAEGYLYAGDVNGELHKIDSDKNQVWVTDGYDQINGVGVDPGAYGAFYQYWNPVSP